MKKSEVVVIGGGIIGASSALQLARQGVKVTVIDSGKIGRGCSFGNAGWMTPCFALPLPLPGLFWKSMKWLVQPQSPLYIQPRLSASLANWLMLFLKSMTEEKAREAVNVLVPMSVRSLELYKELSHKHENLMGFEEKGLLLVAQSKPGLAAAIQELKWVSPLGVPGEVLTAQQTKEKESALTGHIEGSVFFPKEAHGDPYGIISAVRQEAEFLGVEFLEDTKALSWKTAHGKAVCLVTDRGEFEAKHYVLATGVWSADFSKDLGVKVPILGGKGYSFLVSDLPRKPQTPLMLIEKKVAVTPQGNQTRIAGTLELVARDASINPKRVATMIQGFSEFVDLAPGFTPKDVWAGLRPCTPDGLPMIGWSPRLKNVFLACGHQMLGLQTGIGTGELVAQKLMDQKPFVSLELMRPDRFN